MKEASKLHYKAMELVDQSMMARLHGDIASADKFLQEGFEKERTAALLIVNGKKDIEPTRSILCRSAASLALQCKAIREAEQLIHIGLSGNPPDEIAEEMRNLLENVYFERHLQLRDITLEPDKVQLSLAGDSVGFGITNARVFVQRVDNMEIVLFRTAERKLGHPYRDRGKVPVDVKDHFEVYMSAPRAGSFAVTLRLGHSTQMNLPGMDWSGDVVDEVIDCFDFVAKNNMEALSQRINDPAYYRNFVALAKKIAPDGEKIRTVGITAVRKGKERYVALREPPGPIREPKAPLESTLLAETSQLETVSPLVQKQIEGSLRFADSTKSEEEIRIIDKDGKAHRIRVPEGLMDDIVRPMWRKNVIVFGREQKEIFILEDIKPSDE